MLSVKLIPTMSSWDCQRAKHSRAHLPYPRAKKKTLKVYPDKLPLVDEFNGKLFKIGQKVRILLDYPINNTNNARLNGKFRSSDIKWTPQIYKITEVLLKPNYPPMYLTDKNDEFADMATRILNECISLNDIEEIESGASY